MLRLWFSTVSWLMSDIYLRFIQKCFSQLKYVNCHLTPAPANALDKFQYLHFSLVSKRCRLNRRRRNVEQSSCFVLQKEAVSHPENIWSIVTWSLSMEFEAFTSSALIFSRCWGSVLCYRCDIPVLSSNDLLLCLVKFLYSCDWGLISVSFNGMTRRPTLATVQNTVD